MGLVPVWMFKSFESLEGLGDAKVLKVKFAKTCDLSSLKVMFYSM